MKINSEIKNLKNCVWRITEVEILIIPIDPSSPNFIKWSNTQTIHRKQPTNCLSMSDHFVELALKGSKRTCNDTYTSRVYIGYILQDCDNKI